MAKTSIRLIIWTSFSQQMEAGQRGYLGSRGFTPTKQTGAIKAALRPDRFFLSSSLLSASDLLVADFTSVCESPFFTLFPKTVVCLSSRRLKSWPAPRKCENALPLQPPRWVWVQPEWCCPRWLFEVSAVSRSCARPFHGPVGKSLSTVSTFKDDLCDDRVIN